MQVGGIYEGFICFHFKSLRPHRMSALDRRGSGDESKTPGSIIGDAQQPEIRDNLA